MTAGMGGPESGHSELPSPPLTTTPSFSKSLKDLGGSTEGIIEMAQFFLGLALICEKCKSPTDMEACVDIHCAGQLAEKGRMLMEKLGCWTTFHTQCHSHKAQRNVYADGKLRDLQSKGITEKPPKVLKN